MSARRRRGGGRGCRLALAPAGLLLVLAGAQGLDAQAARLEVREIRFVGNARFGRRELAAAIMTRETSCRSWILQPLCGLGVSRALERRSFEPRELRRDVARLDLFYHLRGYREATVDTVVERFADAVAVTFRIREGEPVVVRELGVLGWEGALDAGLIKNLPLRQGDPLSTIALEASRDTLLHRLRNAGFFHADVLTSYEVPRDAPRSARVTLELVPGPRSRFGAITVEGERAVSEAVVRRMLPFRPGDTYSEDRVFQAQRNLYGLQIFTHASVEPRETAPLDSVIPHLVRVNEGNVHRVRAGAGLSTADCVNGETRWSSRNFLGGARLLQLRGRVSNVLAGRFSGTPLCEASGSGIYGKVNWLASAEFTQPWLLSPKNSFNVAVYAERQSLPDIFVRRAVGVNAAVVRVIGRRSLLTLSYRPQLAELDAAEIFFCTSFEVCAPRDVADLQAANWLSPVGLTLSRDRTNRVFAPTAGYTALLDLEHASALTGSEYGYNRVVADLTAYQELRPGWVLAARLRPGALDPRPFGRLSPEAEGAQVVHPQKRFYAGGPNSMRGFAQNQLGPRVLTVDVASLVRGGSPVCSPQQIGDGSCDPQPLPQNAFAARPIGGSALLEGSVELRMPVYGSALRGAAFLDFGQVWSDIKAVRLDEIEVAPGFGLRYFTPIGPVRVDVAYRSAAAAALPVVTTKLRPCEGPAGCENVVVRTADGTEWVRSSELAPLELPKLWRAGRSFFDRLQLHFAIGQAF